VPKITVALSLLAGRGTAYKTQPGVAQLAGRVANEGTATRTSLQIKQELRSIGGSLSIGVDSDATTLSASSLADFAPKLLDLVSDVVRHPSSRAVARRAHHVAKSECMMDELNGRMMACQILITGLIARVANDSPDPLRFLTDFRDEIKAVVKGVNITGMDNTDRVRQIAQMTVDELFSLMKPPSSE